jgi:formylglycine-generating enzyme required for sulfatase activity
MSAANAAPTAHDRYPGTRSFADDEADRRLFFGRDQEIETLTHRVRASRLVVLFGKSGLGKTSLLQAGVYPRLRRHDFLPVPIRFNQPDADPVKTIVNATMAAAERESVDVLTGSREGLWAFFSGSDLWRGETLLAPVLVLDQFEEIFTLQDAGFRSALAAQLRDLAARGIPEAARRAAREDVSRATAASGELPVRIVLSFREEYLGELEALVADVPEILDTRFRLAPLDEEAARKAIVEPAGVEDGAMFRSQRFRYAEQTLDRMLTRLKNRRGEVEPFQLQVLCQHVERAVIERQRVGEHDVVVDDALLTAQAMTEVLSSFYRDALAAIPGRSQRGRARRLCERGLLSPEDRRVSLEEGGLRRQFKLREATLEALIERRLLRKDTRPGLEGYYYELSHDSLIEPVAAARAGRAKLFRNVAIAVPSVLLVGLAMLTREYLADQREVSLTRVAYLLWKKPEYPVLVEVPAGSFLMGSESGADRELPQHTVTISQPFYMSATEVTFDQYEAYWATTGRRRPSDRGWGRQERPVIYVSWEDAQGYVQWLSDQTGNECRLPSEAEWEYAARAGTTTAFALPAPEGSDDIAGQGLANCRDCGSEWDFESTAPVASFPANAWGLHDMHGNVWEWVEDCWHENYAGAPDDGSAWGEEDGGVCSVRVLRGGSWDFSQGYARSADRFSNLPDFRNGNFGFRVLCSSPSSSSDP